ncbi:hypothetical protein CCR97_01170 [Rhodoplanes elegans]|uniref:DUF4145 domain-containing protein n=1 Tax=Rhodoplanes elegans TaxID=29408 RepID=A0A327KKI4_9BRAD|nr:hypothetical protein [Rhodoplanes elegans]MBK5956833.1 hypothetical protein [Rhodoplanes elegans]RAI37852.1 hypothetical protein CH338_14660 [Rhodoplanes elegans]
MRAVSINYHNGFIQLVFDEITNQEVEKPFWRLVSDPKWQNVDYDMKDAIDRRDTQGRDPALYAGKALESTIKIISNERGLSTGRERGAKNYIDNLRSGGILEAWEAETLEVFFKHVRNPLSHGPGAEELTSLSIPQTNWAIESCMSWIKSLIQRADN